ncbi:methyltransferase domain-containing protein [Nocardioides sp.]|uniref:methyltransferase domain-containing protein n=1 Tax=Nocardioides sp. TaxID=35761 RepID=UPI002733116A|nr:methyltransferase domain-containing protein [Nocardioides sp.]MDP3890783.1 methyltransferase domain-containing protein [Nocardioides sp.]
MTTEDAPEITLTPTSFHRGNVAADADSDLASQIFVLDAQEAMAGVGRLRDWALDALAPAAGEVAVDVGCGAGAEVRRLATAVGSAGRAIGVEPHPGLRAEAVRRAQAEGSTATFVDGDAADLPFADGSVDVLRCERVFQHLPDPEAAARDFARVLAPGGRVAVTDSDWGSMVQSVGDPDVVRRINESSWRRMANPFSGRHLRRQLSAAGLEVSPDIGSTAVVLPDELLRDPVMLRLNAALAVEEGTVTAAEAARVEEEVAAAAVSGEVLVAVTMFCVVARRPG